MISDSSRVSTSCSVTALGPAEALCPAFGYQRSSTTMKVVKVAEYIPIIGMVVGAVHLVWSVKKWREGASGAAEHILRALFALANFGFWMILADLKEEFNQRPNETARGRSPSLLDRANILVLRTVDRGLQRSISALDHAEQKSSNHVIEFQKNLVKSKAEEILRPANDVQYHEWQEEVREIKGRARAALERVRCVSVNGVRSSEK